MTTNPQTDPQFGIEGCTCIPFTRQTDPPRYLNRPTDTVDMISGWERGRDCPHHAPAAGRVVSAAPTQTDLRDRSVLSAKLWEIAEQHIVAEWICCEPLEQGHTLCAKGYAALGMVKTLLVDSDPEKAWNPAAPWLDALMGILPPPADRAAVLLEAADALPEADLPFVSPMGRKDVAKLLRRRAAETQQQEPNGVATAEDRCADCGHSRGAHEEAEEPVSVGRCTVCADDDAWHNYEPTDEVQRLAEAQQQPDTETRFVTRVLELFSLSHADAYDELFWRVDDGEVRLFANVSDVFAWGGADCEPITPDTLPALEQDYLDLKAVDGEGYLAPLYAARQRRQRPQGAAYPSGTDKAWREVSALFDACGPERELGLGNPKPAPAHAVPAVVAEQPAAADNGEEQRRG